MAEPETSVPNRLLALLVEADSCEHADDYVCGGCGCAARDAVLSLLAAGDGGDDDA